MLLCATYAWDAIANEGTDPRPEIPANFMTARAANTKDTTSSPTRSAHCRIWRQLPSSIFTQARHGTGDDMSEQCSELGRTPHFLLFFSAFADMICCV